MSDRHACRAAVLTRRWQTTDGCSPLLRVPSEYLSALCEFAMRFNRIDIPRGFDG